MPGGKGMPAVSLPIFSWLTASARRTPSLKAAATRSSSMSLSSASRLGSIVMRLTSCLQVIVTFSRPAPDSPVTSTWASSSWAFFRLSCMACACFMRPASCPLLNMGFLYLIVGHWLDASRDDFRAKVAHHVLDKGVPEDQFLGGTLFFGGGGGVAARVAVRHHANLDTQVDGVARTLQRGFQALTGGGLVQRFALHAQHPVLLVSRHQLGLQSQLAHQSRDGLARHEFGHGGMPEIALFGGNDGRPGGSQRLTWRLRLDTHGHTHHLSGGAATWPRQPAVRA